MSYLCSGSPSLSWRVPFTFKNGTTNLSMEKNGPCGVISSLQAYMIKYIQNSTEKKFPYDILDECILEIMCQIRNSYVFVTDINEEKKRIKFLVTDDIEDARTYLNECQWTRYPYAILNFTLSIVMLVGPAWLKYSSIAEPVIDENGYTSLNFVYLLLTGEVIDNFHRNNLMTGRIVSKGVSKPSEIGLISVASNGEGNVGVYASVSKANIWLYFNGSHFTVWIYSQSESIELDPLISSECRVMDPSHKYHKIMERAAVISSLTFFATDN